MNKFISQIRQALIAYQTLILFSFFAVGLPILLKDVPYLNLILTFSTTTFLYIIITLFFISPRIKTLFLFLTVLLFIAFGLVLFGLSDIAEYVGNLLFLLFVIGIIRVILLDIKKHD